MSIYVLKMFSQLSLEKGQKCTKIQIKREKVILLVKKKIKDVDLEQRTKTSIDLYKDDISLLDTKIIVRESIFFIYIETLFYYNE